MNLLMNKEVIKVERINGALNEDFFLKLEHNGEQGRWSLYRIKSLLPNKKYDLNFAFNGRFIKIGEFFQNTIVLNGIMAVSVATNTTVSKDMFKESTEIINTLHDFINENVKKIDTE